MLDDRQFFADWVRHMSEAAERVGYTGVYDDDTGTWELEVEDKPGRILVRLGSSESNDTDDTSAQVVEAINKGVVFKENIPVRMRQKNNGDWVVVGTEESRELAMVDGTFPSLNVPPHTHRRGGGLDDYVESERFEPALVGYSQGDPLAVYIFPFAYRGGSWAGGDFNLEDAVDEIAANQKAWVLVCYDTFNHSPTWIKTEDYAQAYPLSSAEADAAAAELPPETLPLFALEMYAGHTAINSETQFLDMRWWLGGLLSAADRFFPQIIHAGETITIPENRQLVIAGLEVQGQIVAEGALIAFDPHPPTGGGGGGGSGSVTSVGLSMPSEFAVSNSPITGSGTLTVNKATQDANHVYAGPDSGSAAAPSFRALVADDIPGLAASKITSGTLAHERGGLEADVSAYNGVPFISGGVTSELKHNLSATSLPTVNDDSGDGYSVGSRWVRIDFAPLLNHEWVCVDATPGAAVWRQSSLPAIPANDRIVVSNSGIWTAAAPSFNANAITSGILAHERGGLEADVSAYNGVPIILSGATSELRYNMSATTDPTTGDDDGDGYAIGSRWYNLTDDTEWVCLDASTGAAVWVETTGGTVDWASPGMIGSTTPNSGAFTTLTASGGVVFNEAGDDVDFRVEGGTEENLLFVDASTDRVGIGTNAPDVTLEVRGNRIDLINGSGIAAIHADAYDALGAFFRGRQANGSPGSPSATASDNIIFTFASQGHTGSEFRGGARLRFIATENWDASNGGSSIRFDTVPNGGTSPSARLTVEADGDVDVVNLLRAGGVRVDADPGSGVASTLTLTSVTDTPTASLSWGTVGNPNGYIKAYVGTQAVVIPYWNT